MALQFRQGVREQVGHFPRRAKAIGRLLGLQPGDGGAQPLRQRRIDLADGTRLRLADALEHGQAAGGAERRLAGAHHVQHAAQAEQVGTVVDGFVLGLLGGHVQRRAGNGVGLGGGAAGCLRQPEVGDLDARAARSLVFQEDVARLDIAVDQPNGVRRRQAIRDLLADAQHFLQLERPGLGQLLLQALAGNVLHDHVRDGLFVHRVDGDDVVVADGSPGPGLAHKAPAGRVAAGQVGTEHLDGHQALQLVVKRLQHDAETALTQHFQHLVMAQPAHGAGGS